MPWLVKNDEFGNDKSTSPSIFFVHIPRCGGTALTQAHGVPSRVINNSKDRIRKYGMRMFFYTYYLWETSNFPIWTRWNAFWLAFVALNSYVRFYADLETLIGNDELLCTIQSCAGFNTFFGILMLVSLSLVFVAPNYSRIPRIRRAHMMMVEYLFLGSMNSWRYATGMSIQGWILHLTAHKSLNYQYIMPEDFEECVSLAVVRNPYRRMVSLYMYNRFRRKESFREFVESWYTTVLKDYRNSGVVEEWDTPCHAIPQFEYTHFEGVQLVQSIVKHEEMEELRTPFAGSSKGQVREDKSGKSDDSSPPLYDLPFVVKDAFVDLPRVNQRKLEKPWYDYYDQETLNMTFEMYRLDFAIFHYSSTIAERPDLKPPPLEPIDVDSLGFETMNRNVCQNANPTMKAFRKALLKKAANDDATRTSMGGFQRRVSVMRIVDSKKND